MSAELAGRVPRDPAVGLGRRRTDDHPQHPSSLSPSFGAMSNATGARLPVLPLPLRRRLMTTYLTNLSSRPLLTKSLILGERRTPLGSFDSTPGRPGAHPTLRSFHTSHLSFSAVVLHPVSAVDVHRPPRARTRPRVCAAVERKQDQARPRQGGRDHRRGKGEEDRPHGCLRRSR